MRPGYSVTWSDREVGVISPPVPHILVGHDSTALSRLDRYFDNEPPPRPLKPVNLIPKPLPKVNTIQNLHDTSGLKTASVNSATIDGAACKTSTWTYKHVSSRNNGVSIIEKGARFRPERKERRPLNHLQWKDVPWNRGFLGPTEDYLDLDTRMSSSNENSPQNVIKKILAMTENVQYREAAEFINKLPSSTFKIIMNDLPIDVLVEGMPQTLPLVECLYCKLSDIVQPSIGSASALRPETVVWQMVRFFAQQEECLTGDIRWEFCGPFIVSCKKILKVIARSEPKIRKILLQRRKHLEKAIEGMGHHGLVGTSDESLQSLHDALKLEFEKVLKSYSQAMEKLQELSLSNKQSLQRSISHGPAPVQASHQRQLSITQDEVQERLIKNKTLLNVVEPTLNNHSLDILLGILQRRIDFDKDSLFQFTQLRKEAKEIDSKAVIAPILMRYSHGCEQVLEMLKETFEEDGGLGTPEDDDSGSDVSGYHSDCDSAIMMSGNSPFVSKHVRTNFLTRSVRNRNKSVLRKSLPFTSSHSGTSSGSSDTQSQGSGRTETKSDFSLNDACRINRGKTLPISRENGIASKIKGHELSKQAVERETAALRQEVETLRAEITKARETILHMQDREKKYKERLGERAHRNALERGISGLPTIVRLENISLGEKRPSALERRFSHLYTQTRLDTLDALDALSDLKQAEELKAKLLFSVIVLSFRSVSATAMNLRENIRKLLQLTPLPPRVDLQADPQDRYSMDFEIALTSFIASNIDNHDLTKNVDDVCDQIWATLYDYPCLSSCESLLHYTKACVRVAWGLANQSPPYVLEYEKRTFNVNLHVRFHTSNHQNDVIRTYLWPALLEGPGGQCVHQAIVVT